nr:hypothetical protein Itr_chr03CG25830 [Ipomoea trifida]
MRILKPESENLSIIVAFGEVYALEEAEID